ncbi:MAG: alpha-amylase [Beijerinckiaceae bacterium]|nr:alpha-amylase [Beijerinckiaceae bacterium]
MNAKISTGAAGLAACTNRGSCLPEMGMMLAAAVPARMRPAARHVLVFGLALLGPGEIARAAEPLPVPKTVPAVAQADATKSAIIAPPPPPPAPMGVFGADNLLAQGKLILSITPNFTNLSGILIGTRRVSNEFIVSTVPFFLNPSQTVRIVPQNIAVNTQVVGVRYGVTKDFEMILNLGMVEKNLNALVFRGTAGITQLGNNYPGTASLVDTVLSGIYRVYQDDIHRVHVGLGFSFPTGSNDNTFADFLLPNGTRRNIRGFYGMQLGTGTFDILPGAAYAGYLGPWSWGVSYRGRLPLGQNPQGYLWGDLHEFNGWAGYTWIAGLTTTFRVNGSTQGPIRGFDPQINGPAVPANPLFYGGQRVELFGGASISGKFIGLENATILVEAGLPVYQNLNGPQIMKNWQAGMSLRLKM